MTRHKRQWKYIFGPVPSRRLGFSLGIDVVPFKTCSYDCIYCQLGRTTNKTVTRKEFVPVAEVIKELERILSRHIKIDYITLSGSGEPTLYSETGALISGIKRITGIPVAVLTNGSLLWDDEVRKHLETADLVIPSLDAGNEKIFRYVNRPFGTLDFEKVVDGIIGFSRQRKTRLWLEVFLLHGVNSMKSEIIDIDSIIQKINPDKVQLNTVKRPPAESYALPVPEDLMKELASYMSGNVEIIADFRRQTDDNYFRVTQDEIMNLLKRRPCSLKDISGGLRLHKNEVLKYLDELIKNNKLITYEHHHTLYYAVK
jgi:wyosine [tRNA(Phe)-imidazoG37] synthetase (radical SAM superfamily)